MAHGPYKYREGSLAFGFIFRKFSMQSKVVNSLQELKLKTKASVQSRLVKLSNGKRHFEPNPFSTRQ